MFETNVKIILFLIGTIKFRAKFVNTNKILNSINTNRMYLNTKTNFISTMMVDQLLQVFCV